MTSKTRIDQGFKSRPVGGKQTGPFGKVNSLRTVAAVIHNMTRGLVGQQIDLQLLCRQVLEQINHIAVVGDRGIALRGQTLPGGTDDLG